MCEGYLIRSIVCLKYIACYTEVYWRCQNHFKNSIVYMYAKMKFLKKISKHICKHKFNKNCTLMLDHTDGAFHYSLNQIFRCSVWFGWNVNYSWFTCIHNCMTFWKSGRLFSFYPSLPPNVTISAFKLYLSFLRVCIYYHWCIEGR